MIVTINKLKDIKFQETVVQQIVMGLESLGVERYESVDLSFRVKRKEECGYK